MCGAAPIAEARGCLGSELLCAYASVDVGYQHANTTKDVSDTMNVFIKADDLLLVPRVAAEIGRRVRFRLAFELPMYLRVDEHETGSGAMHSAGLGYKF